MVSTRIVETIHPVQINDETADAGRGMFCTTDNGPLVALTASLFHETQSWRLSLKKAWLRGWQRRRKAAKSPRATKSALVEAALDRLLWL